MSTHGRVLSFDPTLAAVAGAILKETGAGGGLISANGTYYSIPSHNHSPGAISEGIDKTGTLAGTLTVEVSNDGEDEDRAGTSKWYTHPSITGIPAIATGAQSFPIEDVSCAFLRWRLKLVITGGTGTIRAKRAVLGT
jgi:hypothetical protein